MSRVLESFFKEIGYKFSDKSLFEEAITHPSVNQDRQAKDYQRLEFLGDSILSMVIAEILIKTYSNDNEGLLSKRQAYLVRGSTLCKIANKIGLGEVMIFSKNEENNNGRQNKRTLENGLEALIGAIYLDSNLENCQKFVKKYWQNLIQEDIIPQIDPVSNLQEITQAKNKSLPKYQTTRSGGNEHEPIFTCVIEVDGQRYAANGASKKEAQKKAAQYAVDEIANLGN